MSHGRGIVQSSPGPAPGDSIRIDDTWEILLVSDETLNDSDKTLTVPATYEYQILWIWIELATTATVGDRQIEIRLLDDAADTIGQFRAGVVQAASLTRYYMFAASLADLLGFRDTDYLMSPIPPTLFVSAGQAIRIWDNNAVDAAADDMIIQMQVARKIS